MPRPLGSKKAAPSYSKHRASGQAVAYLNGRTVYLGPHGTAASRREYDRVVAEFLSNGRRTDERRSVSVVELIALFWRHAETYYRHPDGRPTSELAAFRQALRPLRRLYGSTPAVEFGPLSLRAVQSEMIRLGWARQRINREIRRIRRVFKWAASQELLTAEIHHALQSVEPLRAGRSDAKESSPVQPVDEAIALSVARHVSPQVGAMIQFQLLTGCRPGEACALRGCDVDRSGPLWIYRPPIHKTAWRGHRREILIGPRAQEALRPFMKRDPEEFLFSPLQAEAWRRAQRAAARKTPLSCGNRAGTNVAKEPKRTPGRRYSGESYARAVAKGCLKAFPPPVGLEGEAAKSWQREHHFHPNQLRHTAATRLRREYGIEAAQVVLGHRTLAVTEVYAAKNLNEGARIIAAAG